MELEERTIESLPDRCESCGTPLTDDEKQRVLDEGSARALCHSCAAEQEPAEDVEEAEAEEGL